MQAVSKGDGTSQLAMAPPPLKILTWLVLGSFSPREPFSLTYISHPPPSFSNHSSLPPSAGAEGWGRVTRPSRIEGRAGKCLPITSPGIISCRKINAFSVWLIVWSLPQGSPGTPGYPGAMGPPGLPVRRPHSLVIKKLQDWQQPSAFNGWMGSPTDVLAVTD